MKKQQILASEFFKASPTRCYFIDIVLAENGRYFLRIVRSDLQQDGSHLRTVLVVFEDNFFEFITAFSSAFQSAAFQGQPYQTLKDIARECRASQGIKAMPESERPRERMFNHGPSCLSDCELLAILLGAGTPGETAIELASKILDGHSDLHGLSKSSFPSLCRHKGMGMAKACSVLAAVELSKRINTRQTKLFDD
ncbi:UPF0758 domain-containing protein [Pedobacter aquatilis]|uniref:UPF0758 domain-containing protein n=1 Tax=Pedobacter aquatilis TaxID=351343 RepID=UPI00292D2B75|nr:UPF0758 domain-containing protein [Pedobacter aquatilis]